MKKHIPNALTCGNLLCGCLGIHFAYQGQLQFAAYLIAAAAVFDFFDGFVARWLKVQSAIGKELDSLADMVSFGLLPGVLMLHLIDQNGGQDWKYIALSIPIFSALRLAKFNIDTRQSDAFIGLPTPACAMVVASLVFSAAEAGILANPYLLAFISVFLSGLLVAELPLIALKFKHFAWKGNEFRFSLIFISVALVASLGWKGLALAVVAYVLLSVLEKLKK